MTKQKIMKKLILLLVAISFIFANVSFASQNTTTSKTLKTNISVEKTGIWGKIDVVKEKISKGYEKIKKTLVGGTLRTSLLLMLVGLLFIVLASIIGGGDIVLIVGAIFLFIGAALLLLYLL